MSMDLMCILLCSNDNSMETHPSSPIDVWLSDYTKESICRNWAGDIRTIARSRWENGRVWHRIWIDDKKYKNEFRVIPVRINTTARMLLVFRGSLMQCIIYQYPQKICNCILYRPRFVIIVADNYAIYVLLFGPVLSWIFHRTSVFN